MEKVSRFFPASTIGTVDQNGIDLTNRSYGVHVDLHSHAGCPPHSAEVYNDDCSLYADIGLEFDGNSLVGYDGCFDIPAEVLTMLNDMGFNTSEL